MESVWWKANGIDLFKILLAYSTDSAVINRNAPLPHFSRHEPFPLNKAKFNLI